MGSSPRVSAKKADTKSPVQTNAKNTNAEPPATTGKSINSILAVAVVVDATGEGRASLSLLTFLLRDRLGGVGKANLYVSRACVGHKARGHSKG
jgi:hypothetical protein